MVDSIVDPTGVPGARYMDKVVVKLYALIKAQKATTNPALLTEDMQVEILLLFFLSFFESSPFLVLGSEEVHRSERLHGAPRSCTIDGGEPRMDGLCACGGRRRVWPQLYLR